MKANEGPLAGVYVFALPEGAALSRLKVATDGRKIPSQVQERHMFLGGRS